jgi:hypothetical protein
MEKQVEELIAKYNEGLADPSEIKAIEQLIEGGKIDLLHLRDLHRMNEHIIQLEGPTPSLNLDDKFYAMLTHEKRRAKQNSFSFSLGDWSSLFPKLSLAAVLLVLGFAGGFWLQRDNSPNIEVRELTQQVGDLKEMMMLTLLEKESATERLKAVSLSSDLPVSEKITTALFQTLNKDENVNVRLAALEALKVYSKNSEVREGLIRSIALQDNPLIQVALAELMVSIQEKKSVKELQKLLDSDKTPSEVKSKLKESISVLI